MLFVGYMSKKIAGGISDTEFSLEMACTRGQIITFLYNAM